MQHLYAPMWWRDEWMKVMRDDEHYKDKFYSLKPDQERVDKWGAERRALLSEREDFIICKRCGAEGLVKIDGKREKCPECEGSGYENFRE